MKNTRQRAAILRVLEESAEPLSAEEVYSRLCGEEPAMALSTVYRNLERFCAENLLHRDTFGDSVVRYSLARRHGHYLICTGCDARVRIDGCPLSALEEGLARDTGFSIESHTLTIYGKCPHCAAKEQSAHEPVAAPKRHREEHR